VIPAGWQQETGIQPQKLCNKSPLFNMECKSSIVSGAVKFRMLDILVLAYPGCPENWLLAEQIVADKYYSMH